MLHTIIWNQQYGCTLSWSLTLFYCCSCKGCSSCADWFICGWPSSLSRGWTSSSRSCTLLWKISGSGTWHRATKNVMRDTAIIVLSRDTFKSVLSQKLSCSSCQQVYTFRRDSAETGPLQWNQKSTLATHVVVDFMSKMRHMPLGQFPNLGAVVGAFITSTSYISH